MFVLILSQNKKLEVEPMLVLVPDVLNVAGSSHCDMSHLEH